MERLGRDNLLKTQNDGIRHKVQYKKRRCFTHRQAFTTRNKNKVANSPWVASVWFPQTKAIGWSFQCTAQTVVRKQRQYGGGAPMANVSQLKIMANSDRQSPWKLGHLSRGCAAALPSSVLRRCLCCRFQRSSAPGQGRMVHWDAGFVLPLVSVAAVPHVGAVPQPLLSTVSHKVSQDGVRRSFADTLPLEQERHKWPTSNKGAWLFLPNPHPGDAVCGIK